MESIGQRIRLLRDDKKLSQEAMGRILGVTGVAISRLENGSRNVTDQMVILLCAKFGVSEAWLTEGRGEMYDALIESGIDEIARNCDATKTVRTFLDMYARLTPEGRAVVDQIVDSASTAIRQSPADK